MSTYKIVTVNASRQLSDPYASVPRPITPAGKRLTSHPEDSATIEQEIVDEELQTDPNAKDEMQTWMLLEVSNCIHASLLTQLAKKARKICSMR